MASCTITCTDGMVVKTQLTSEVADKSQRGVMELLLINHPLDCPVCDKGGECPLQNQAMSHGNAESRFEGRKRTYEKPVPISTQVLLDRERCVLCARCTRFSNEIAERPDDRAARTRCAPAGRHRRGRPLRVLLLRQHHPDLPGRRPHLGRVPVPLPPLRPRLLPERVRALCGRLRDPDRPPPRQGAAPDGRRGPRGQRGMGLRQGPLRVPLRTAAGPADHPARAQRGRRPGARELAGGP